jgi:hypothetical protein
MASSLSIPMLTVTSDNFLEFQSKLRRVLVSKGLWHICDPEAMILTHPSIKVEKGTTQVLGYVAPTPAEHDDLSSRGSPEPRGGSSGV